MYESRTLGASRRDSAPSARRCAPSARVLIPSWHPAPNTCWSLGRDGDEVDDADVGAWWYDDETDDLDDEEDEEDDGLNVSLAAMEEKLKPKVLNDFNDITNLDGYKHKI